MIECRVWRAESPMTSIAQGKRSDTLGKPPHHITPRPARAKVNITRSVSALLPLQGANYTAHYTQGVASLAAGLWTSAPFGACLFERISSRPRHVAFSHAYNSPHAIKSVLIRRVGGASKIKQ